MEFPAAFVKTQVEMHGEAGQAWLDGLPVLLTEYSEKWGLSLGPHYSNLSFNYVAPGTREDGSEVVIKMGVPTPGSEMAGEIAALHHFGGRGAVQLLESDLEAGVMLIERAVPGTMLSTVQDDIQATQTFSRVMRRLHRPPNETRHFRRLSEWIEGFDHLRERFGGGTGPLPQDMVERAEKTGEELLASTTRDVVLHGDLHHFNILSSERGPWLAIDPKGVLGDPAYEPAPFLGNSADTLPLRVDVLVEEIGFDRERILGWGFVYAMMSAWWTIEDGGEGWEGAIELGRRFHRLSPS